MIKHIVFWKIRDDSGANSKMAIMKELKAVLEALNGKIPSLKHLEVGFDISKTESSFDVALYSEFEDKKGLAAYIEHPEHQKVIPFVKSVSTLRQVVDYEV